jgi:hypothetical protein
MSREVQDMNKVEYSTPTLTVLGDVATLTLNHGVVKTDTQTQDQYGIPPVFVGSVVSTS